MTKCIIVPRRAIILAFVCLATAQVCSAAVGHKIRNGGGDAELAFVDAWAKLSGYMSVCLEEQSPCRLNKTQRAHVRRLLALQSKCYPHVFIEDSPEPVLSLGTCGKVLRINSTGLYENGEPVTSRAALMNLALRILDARSCEASLATSPLHIPELIEQRERVVYFARHREGETAMVVQNLKTDTGHQLSTKNPTLAVELNDWIATKLGESSQPLRFQQLHSAFHNQKLEVRGTVVLSDSRKANFWLWLNQDLNLAKANLIVEP